MDERHLPLILEQLGVEECGERKRKMSFRTEELLAVDPEQPSMKLII
jgi:hypothetical protein